MPISNIKQTGTVLYNHSQKKKLFLCLTNTERCFILFLVTMEDAMQEGITLQQLESELKKLDAQRDLLVKYIALRKGENIKAEHPTVPQSSGGSSVRGRIIDAAVELIHKEGRQVTNKEIMAYIEEKQLSLGNVKNRVTGLGAILNQESKKTSGRIKQVTRGVWDMK
jgi:hypothetical protein